MIFKRFALTLLLLVTLAVPARAMDIERVVSPGGIEAWLVRDKMLPVLALEFTFRGGIALDPVGKEGRSLMAVNLLTEGAGDLDSQAFATQVEDKAISMDFNATYNSLTGSLKTLNEHRDAAIDLLRLAMTKPRMEAADIERLRAATLSGIARDNESPDYIARRTYMTTAFANHPYGRPSRGTKESVAALTEADFRAVIAQRFARDNLVVGAVGDITPEELGKVLDRAFGDLPAKAAPIEVADATPAGAGRTLSCAGRCRRASSCSASPASNARTRIGSRHRWSTTCSAVAASTRDLWKKCARSAASPMASTPRSRPTTAPAW